MKSNNWISVNERLPETPQWVLCYFPGEKFSDVMYYRDIKYKTFDEQEGRIISHWMPLPSPPKSHP